MTADSGNFDTRVPAAISEFARAADRAGQPGLEEPEFLQLAASVTSLIVNTYAPLILGKSAELERIVDLCGEANTNTVVRDEFHRLAGRLLADLPAEIQAGFVSVCLDRLDRDLWESQDTQTWRPIAYVLAANYSLIRSGDQRRQLIHTLKQLTTKNPKYKHDFFIEDLLLIHERMRLGHLEELKETLELSHSGEKP